ncbi:neutral amino acid permease [Fusarium globosum]|uniref:Neutral amino acid permease n=1 Tax=Fusarium globosum TaxID=78864 RepID=A0A8H5Y9N1_9HYPO|nr:neutral amino acid permease [Fusarium globosum]
MTPDDIAVVEEANNSNSQDENKISLAASNWMRNTLVSEAIEDEVFGTVGEGGAGPNYRGLSWISTIAVMTKTQVGLGVLAIPKTFHTLGLIPGVFCLIAIGGMTSWSGYIVGTFKLKHKEVYTIDDAGKVMFGRVGREIFAVILMLNWVFVSASAMLGISVALNAVSNHALCTWAFVIFAAVSTGLLASIRTLGKIGWIAWVGIAGIMTAIFSVTIAVGVEKGNNPAVTEGNSTTFGLFNAPPFADGMAAVSSHIFAYAGVPAYFPIIAEMQDQEHYTSALIWSQSIMTAVYVVIGVVMYCFVGSEIASPALGSAGPVMKKVSYGFALPGLLVSAMIVTHLPAKYIFLRILRGSEHLHRNSLIHWGAWLGCIGGITILAYIIASAIPVFDPLVSLIGASFGVFLCFQPYGCMWLHDNWKLRRPSLRWKGKIAWSVFIIIIGAFLTIRGTHGSIEGLIFATRHGSGKAWSCADNSNPPPPPPPPPSNSTANTTSTTTPLLLSMASSLYTLDT